MAVQFNEQKPEAVRLFQSLIYSPNLVSLHPLNEKSGTVILDRCLVNRLTGGVLGNPTYSKDIGGFYGLDLDGTGDCVSLGTAIPSWAFERTDSFSGLCIINPNVSAIGHMVSQQHFSGAADVGWAWYVTAGRLPGLVLSNTTSGGNLIRVESTTALTNGVPTMLGFTYTGTSLATGVTLYRNGVVDTDTDVVNALSASIISVSAVASIGAHLAGTKFFNGDISMATLWDRALSAAEMRLYASVSGFL